MSIDPALVLLPPLEAKWRSLGFTCLPAMKELKTTKLLSYR